MAKRAPARYVVSVSEKPTEPEDEDALVDALETAARLPRPNAAAREAAQAHDIVTQVARIEDVLRRAAPAAAGAVTI